MKKHFPLDIEALVKLGGPEFIKKNPIWVVNGQKLNKEVDIFFKNFISTCEKKNNDKKKVMYADYGFVFYVAQKTHMLLAKNILEKKNKKVLSFNNSSIFLSNNQKLRLITYSDKEDNSDLVSKIKIFLKKIIINIYLKKNYFFNRPYYLDFGGTSKIKIKYAKDNKINLIKDYEDHLFSFKNKTNFNFYYKTTNKLVSIFQKKINKVFKTNINLYDLDSIWADRLSKLDCELNNHLKKTNKLSGALIENTSKPTSRILSSIYQIKKKHTVGFAHGRVVHPGNYTYTALDPLAYDSFLTYSKKSIVAQERSIMNYFNKEKLKNTKIKYLPSGEETKNSYFANTTKRAPKKIKKIMVMGWPMNSRVYFHAKGHFFYNKISAELRLINMLKKNGFYVIYKSHPERPQGIIKFFKDLADEIIFDNFENKKVNEKADAYFFNTIGSSALVTALCSNKHVFLLDDTSNFYKDHLNSLKKRVNVINSKFTDRYLLDEKTIIGKINNPIRKFNYEYVKKFLF